MKPYIANKDSFLEQIFILILVLFPFFSGYFTKPSLCFVLLIILLPIFFLGNRIKTQTYSLFEFAMLLMILWQCISLLFGTNWYEGIFGILFWTFQLFFVLLAKTFFKSREDAHNTYYNLIFKIGVFVACQNYFVMIFNQTSDSLFRFEVGIPYANSLAIFFLVCFIIGMYKLSLKIIKKRDRNFFMIGEIILLSALIMTYSRISWVIAIIFISISMVLFFKGKKSIYKKLVFLSLIGGAVILIIISMGFHDSIMERIRSIQLNATELNERFAYYYDSLNIIKENPVMGLGNGGWSSRQGEFQSALYAARYVHSSILQIAVENGIIGLFIFIVVCFYPLAIGLKNLKRENRLILPLLCNISLLSHSLLDFDLSIPIMMGIYNCNSCYILLLLKKSERPIFKSQNAGFLIAKKVILILMILATTSLYGSEIYYRIGYSAYQRSDLTSAIKNLSISAQLNPFNSDVPYIKGYLYKQIYEQSQNKEYKEWSINMFETAQKLDKNNSKYEKALSEIDAVAKDYECSIKHLENLIGLQPLLYRNYKNYEKYLIEERIRAREKNNDQEEAAIEKKISNIPYLIDKAKEKYSYWTFRVKHTPKFDDTIIK